MGATTFESKVEVSQVKGVDRPFRATEAYGRKQHGISKQYANKVSMNLSG